MDGVGVKGGESGLRRDWHHDQRSPRKLWLQGLESNKLASTFRSLRAKAEVA